MIKFILKHLDVNRGIHKNLLTEIEETLVEKEQLEQTNMALAGTQFNTFERQSYADKKHANEQKLNKLKMQFSTTTGITMTDLTAIKNRLAHEVNQFDEAMRRLQNPMGYVYDNGSSTHHFEDEDDLEQHVINEVEQSQGNGETPQEAADSIEDHDEIYPVLNFPMEWQLDYKPGEMESRRDHYHDDEIWVLFKNDREEEEFTSEEDLLEDVKNRVEDGDDVDDFRYEHRDISGYSIEESDSGEFEFHMNTK